MLGLLLGKLTGKGGEGGRADIVSRYLDVSRGDGRDLFFYFFESRNKPKDDPVIMWINGMFLLSPKVWIRYADGVGGPGCSSALGLFMELGPCTVNDKPKSANDTTSNPYSWNQNVPPLSHTLFSLSRGNPS